MSLLRYFKKNLPSADETNIGEVATKEASQRVQVVLASAIRGEPGPSGRRKRKAYAIYTVVAWSETVYGLAPRDYLHG